jgi:hypothetical protein
MTPDRRLRAAERVVAGRPHPLDKQPIATAEEAIALMLQTPKDEIAFPEYVRVLSDRMTPEAKVNVRLLIAEELARRGEPPPDD